jgi:hypothetical protein
MGLYHPALLFICAAHFGCHSCTRKRQKRKEKKRILLLLLLLLLVKQTLMSALWAAPGALGSFTAELQLKGELE